MIKSFGLMYQISLIIAAANESENLLQSESSNESLVEHLFPKLTCLCVKCMKCFGLETLARAREEVHGWLLLLIIIIIMMVVILHDENENIW